MRRHNNNSYLTTYRDIYKTPHLWLSNSPNEWLILYISIEILLGSPYKFHVDSLSSGGLTAYGPGLTAGKCGEPCVFTISTKNASGPLLSLSVEGPSKAKVSFQQVSQQFLLTNAIIFFVSDFLHR